MTQAPSLVRELKSCKLQDEAKGKKRLCIEKDYVCMYVSTHIHVHGFLSSVKMYLHQHFWHLVKPIGAHFCLIFPIELFLV